MNIELRKFPTVVFIHDVVSKLLEEYTSDTTALMVEI